MADPSKDIDKDGVIRVIEVTNDEEVDKTVDQRPLMQSIKGPISLKNAGVAYTARLSDKFPNIPVFASGSDPVTGQDINVGAVNRNKWLLAGNDTARFKKG